MGTLVFLSLRAREYIGRNIHQISDKLRIDHNIEQDDNHTELPRPDGWCTFSGNLWHDESTQIFWCSLFLGQGST